MENSTCLFIFLRFLSFFFILQIPRAVKSSVLPKQIRSSFQTDEDNVVVGGKSIHFLLFEFYCIDNYLSLKWKIGNYLY